MHSHRDAHGPWPGRARGDGSRASRLLPARQLALPLLAAGLLTACANTEPRPDPRGDGYSLTARIEQAREMLPFLEDKEPKAELAMPYCYKSLGRPDCYTQPLTGAPRTRLDWYHDLAETPE